MRKQNKVILWPVYFDSTKTRLQGRRIPRGLAIASPRLDELQKATERCDLQPEVIPDVKHPRAPWQKNGFIVVPKSAPKTRIIRNVAKELSNVRVQNRI